MRLIALNSYTSISVNCPHCKEVYEVKYCSIVDLEWNSDFHDYQKNKDTCPKCGKINNLDLPTLVLQRTNRPHLFFITDSSYSSVNAENLEYLFSKLKKQAGSQWNEIWSNENVWYIEHRFLPYIFEQFIQCQINETIALLQLKLFNLIQLREAEHKRQMILANPELVSFQVVDALQEMVLFSEFLEDNMSSIFDSNIQILELTLLVNKIERPKTLSAVVYETSPKLNKAFWELKRAEAIQDYKSAISLYLAAFEIAKDRNKPYFIARYSGNFFPWLAMVANTALESIIAFLEWAAKELKTNSNYSMDYQLVHMNLGNLYLEILSGSRKENIEKSISYSFMAIDIPNGNQVIPDINIAYHNLGRAYTERLVGDKSENFETSIDFFKRAQSLRDPIKDAYNIAGTNTALGVAYFNRFRGSLKKNLEKSITFHDKAVEYYRLNDLNDDLADALVNKASSYILRLKGVKTENVRHAIECCEEALIIHSKRYPPEQKAKILSALANAYFDYLDGSVPENLAKSIAYHKQAIDVLKNAIDTRALASYQMNLANAYCRRPTRNTIETAIDLYKLALQNLSLNNHGHEYFEIHLNLAAAYIERIEGDETQNYEKAIAYYTSAEKVFTRKDYPFKWAQMNYGLARGYSKLSKENKGAYYLNAIKCYENALKIFTIADFPRLCRAVQTNFADLYLEHNEWGLASLSYRKAIEAGEGVLLEALNGTGHRHEIGQNSTLYACLAYCLAKLGRYEEAFLAADNGKTRALAESLEIEHIADTILPNSLRTRLTNLTTNVKDLEYKLSVIKDSDKKDLVKTTIAKLVEKRAKLNKLKKELRVKFSKTFSNKLSLKGFIDLVPKGGAMVVPILTKKGTVVILLTRDRHELRKEHVIWADDFKFKDFKKLLVGNYEENKNEYSGWVGDYESFMLSSNFFERRYNWNNWIRTMDNTYEKLWQHLFGPIHNALQKEKLSEGSRLIIIPQGGLGILPLHAAFRNIEGKRRYLVEDYTINYVPSGQVLKQSLQRASSNEKCSNTMLAVINPTSDLAYANSEGEVIKKYFNNNPETKSLVQGDATIQNVVDSIEDKTYLHFACHGYYDWTSPEKSGLLMANRESISLAFIKSILDLRENKLTVLSACETGVIDIIKAPDEFVSLPSGLIQVGVPTVLSTLWTVEDKSTQLLIGEFYRNHVEEGKSISVSLREAQKWLMNYNNGEGQRPYEHPFYWAGFMVFGLGY